MTKSLDDETAAAVRLLLERIAEARMTIDNQRLIWIHLYKYAPEKSLRLFRLAGGARLVVDTARCTSVLLGSLS